MLYVITHKIFDDDILPGEGYKVMHVGVNNQYKDYYLQDNTMDNISEKNEIYCELTGLYWIWKNATESPEDIVGLLHYRRYFTHFLQNKFYNYGGKKPDILDYSFISNKLSKYDIILPISKKTFKTVAEIYGIYHIKEDLDILRNCIQEISPDYIPAYDKVINSHYYYYASMMCCSKKLLDEYCEWLFKLLPVYESMIDFNKYTDSYQRRVIGFMGERLLQIWVEKNQLKIYECPAFNTEVRDETLISMIAKKFKKNNT